MSSKDEGVGEGKWIDMSSQERLIKYSRDIQNNTLYFLMQNVGQLFDDDEDLITQCQNTMIDKKGHRPSMEAIRRWIKTFTAKNGDYEKIDTARGIVIQKRIKEVI